VGEGKAGGIEKDDLIRLQIVEDACFLLPAAHQPDATHRHR
jgi:hypothetical protein